VDTVLSSSILRAVEQPVSVTIEQSPSPPLRRASTLASRTIIWLLIGAGLCVAFDAGIRVRRWAFDVADPIRFIDDTARGFYWGLNASGPEGYLNQYDKMDPEEPEWKNSLWVPWLDYGPLRLLVMREWAAWQRVRHPPDPNASLMDVWQRPYAFNAPVLFFNTTMEAFAAVCAFFLTRLWVIRASPTNDGHFLGVWQGIVAALLLWFSPDIIICAHAWFQWDAWAVPWYLCACLLASLDWWFAAGAAIAIGIMFKGQMLGIAPIFIIWPLVQGRFGAALRWIWGIAFGVAVITSGWLITYIPADRLLAARNIQSGMAVSQFPPDLFAIPRVFDMPAALWIFGMLIITASASRLLGVLMQAAAQREPARFKALVQSRWTWTVGVTLFIIAAVYWPWLLSRNRGTWYFGLLAGAVIAGAAFFLRKGKRYVLATIFAGGLLSCIGLFHGSTAWWDCAFHYGSVHWPYLAIGPTSNIPALCESSFGWERGVDQIAFTLPALHGHWPTFISHGFFWPAFDWDITAKMFFNSIYGIMLVISGIAIGLQARRNDRRMLVALATPWIMFFLFPVQIQERYLLYAAGAAACCIGNSVGTALLGFVLTLSSAAMQLALLLDWSTSDLNAFGQNLSRAFPRLFSPECGQSLARFFRGLHPDMGWAIFLVGMVFLYLSLTPSRRRKRYVSPEFPTTS
jgi:hypothetical protein